MRWSAGGCSSNLEARRGESVGGGGFGVGRGLGIGGTIIVLILSLIFGRDFIGGSDTGGSAAYPDQTTSSGGEVAPAQSSPEEERAVEDRKSTRLNSSHEWISYAVF